MRTVQRVGEVVGRHKFWIAAFLMAVLSACVEEPKSKGILSAFFGQ
jgi:hypothetical protein